MTEVEAFEKLKSVMQSVPDLRIRVPIESLQPTHAFRRDLGFDSLAVVSLFMELQDAFPDLEEDQAAKWVTLHDAICSMVAAK